MYKKIINKTLSIIIYLDLKTTLKEKKFFKTRKYFNGKKSKKVMAFFKKESNQFKIFRSQQHAYLLQVLKVPLFQETFLREPHILLCGKRSGLHEVKHPSIFRISENIQKKFVSFKYIVLEWIEELHLANV